MEGGGEMVSVPDVAMGAVLAALMVGTVSLLGLIISKEQKHLSLEHDRLKLTPA